MSLENRSQRIKIILISILCLNWLVSSIKLILGYIIKSNSMVADGYHSFSDGASNIIGLLGIWFATRPKDESHPYGHKKYETFACLGIVFLLFFVSWHIVQTSINRIFNPIIPHVTLLSLLVMFSTLIVNFAVMSYEYRMGKKLHSDILIADSAHTKADILTSASVIVALFAVKLNWPLLDPAVALFIAIFIAYTAFTILKKSSLVLCDSAVIDTKKIEEVVMNINDVLSVHKIRTRGRCDDIYIDLHVEVKPDMRIDKAHKLSERIEHEIKNKISGVSDVVVHMEPRQ